MPTLTFKVSEAEAAAIRNRARQSRLNFSTYARRVMLADGTPPPKQKYKDIIKPGYVVLDGPPLTTEELHAALYDDY